MRFFLLALVLVFLTALDAKAFGRRNQQPQYSSCGPCVQGQCASACATGCFNGQCSQAPGFTYPSYVLTPQGYVQSPACPGGVCPSPNAPGFTTPILDNPIWGKPSPWHKK